MYTSNIVLTTVKMCQLKYEVYLSDSPTWSTVSPSCWRPSRQVN